MSIRVKMMSNVLAHIPSANHHEVSFESVHQCARCLAYILFPALLTRDAVDQICTLAGDIHFAFISLLGVMASYLTTMVNFWAILIISCLASIDGLTTWYILGVLHWWSSIDSS